MLCKKCGYALWNLPPGRCPECGDPFAPSQFRFLPGKVNFLCPHCQQPYMASSQDGQPTQESFPCNKCGQTIQVDQMLVTPAPGVPHHAAEAVRMPWLERKRLGWWKAFWRTVGLSLLSPSQVVVDLPKEEGTGTGAALGFAMSAAAFVAIVGLAFAVVFWTIILGISGGLSGAGVGSGMILWPMLTGFGCIGLGVILWPLIGVGLWSLVTHLLLRMTGKRAGGLSLTYRAMLYGQGPLVIQAVPMCGSYVAGVWMAVSSTIMVKQSQEVRGLRAAFAVLAPPLSLLGLYIGSVLFFIFGVVGAGSGGWMGGYTTTGVSPIGVVMVSSASPETGAGPRHILELVADEQLLMQELVDPLGGNPDWGDIAVGDWTAGELQDMPREELLEVAVYLAGQRDPASTWYRFGDLVFCYDGLDFRPQAIAGERWVVAYQYDVWGEYGAVFYTDGDVEYFDWDMDWTVDTENTRRTTAGLPLIPTLEEAFPEAP
jgi:hypothetical protein